MAEMQDILRQYAEGYRKAHPQPYHIVKVMNAISNCRTADLGAHIDCCEDCGNVLHISYSSCRNRHCPKCQALARERWVERQKADLLDVGYFHVVFTIPDTLNPIAFQNQREVYALFFRAVSETLKELAATPKYLGARIGFTAVLHTWGQNLMHHPHIHCIVPGGGIDKLGRWVNSRKKFFIPVRVLSRKFRGKFLYLLAHANLQFHGRIANLDAPIKWSDFRSSLYQKEWVVYCKPPFKHAAAVVEYLGRYTHRVAISNQRILNVENDQVTFKWRDYKDGSKWKTMTVSAHEFIRRFLTHVLPPRFMKIRHFGLLSNRGKNSRLHICKQLTGTPILPKTSASTLDLVKRLICRDVSVCPHCGSIRRSTSTVPTDSS